MSELLAVLSRWSDGQCVATLALPKGQVTVQGLLSFTDPTKVRFVHAVTGGTGAYRTAHGELVGQTINANQTT